VRRLPLSDTLTLRGAARRTRAAGLVLGAVLVVLVVALVFTTRVRPPAADILPGGASGIVVLDLSGSTRNYPAPIANALRQLTRDGHRRLGLVVFSDTAYEALPPRIRAIPGRRSAAAPRSRAASRSRASSSTATTSRTPTSSW
jgi:hypothetical protein